MIAGALVALFLLSPVSAHAKPMDINNRGQLRTDFVDVSSHQGLLSVADYQAMKNEGLRGVSVKLTEGTTYVNPYASIQIANAKTAELTVSVYHYSWLTSPAQAIAEANFFANTAEALGLSKETLMVNDAEEPQVIPKLSYEQNTQNNATFENQLKARGYKNVQVSSI